MSLRSNLLLMTCRVRVEAADASMTDRDARALLDSVSYQCPLFLNTLRRGFTCLGTARTQIFQALACDFSVTSFEISSIHSHWKFSVTAVIMPCVTCDLQMHPIPSCEGWRHLSGIKLADPDFGTPRRIDLLLGLRPLLKWWVRAGGAEPQLHSIRTLTGCCQVACLLTLPHSQVAAHHVSLPRGDDLIQKFWEIELVLLMCWSLSHAWPTTTKTRCTKRGHARTVCRFQLFKHSLHAKGQFEEFEVVIKFKAGHSEEVPFSDIEKPPEAVFTCPLRP